MLHTYLVLALVARLLGTRVIIEFHEILDTGEAGMPLVRAYVSALAPLLFRLADAYTVHSQFDRGLLSSRYRLSKRRMTVLPHGPHDHYQSNAAEPLPASREAPEDVCNLLFFGVIRPFKGLEDLIAAFDAIPAGEISGYWLTVVGETWEEWTLPSVLIEQSRYRERITFVNRYVHDRELDAYLRGSDAVILPYHRSSLSGPLHVAMGYGLPIVISDAGGNAEAAAGYGGIILTKPSEPVALRGALAQAARLRGKRFRHPADWSKTARTYEELFEGLGVAKAPGSP